MAAASAARAPTKGSARLESLDLVQFRGAKVLRFSIGDVLWLTLVAALVIGWSLDHLRQFRAASEMSAQMQSLSADLKEAQEIAEREWRVLNHSMPSSDGLP